MSCGAREKRCGCDSTLVAEDVSRKRTDVDFECRQTVIYKKSIFDFKF